MVKVCVVGCLHGELDCVYSDIAEAEQQGQFKTDLVLCCGDFQAVRNPSDLTTMSVPSKYYRMGDFWRYYAEESRAPVLTLFVGGNHEASAYLQELPYGGWVAPNIWYMGYASVVQFAGLRIAGLSGIYKPHDYTMCHYEHLPYSEATKRSVYHLRNLEVFRLGQIRRRLDILISHDWPRGIYHYGNTNQLTRKKPHFRGEIESDSLGSPPGEQLLCRLKPRYWFSAHLHCKFSALVDHSHSKTNKSRTTYFLALDKCLPNRHYLQFLDIEPEAKCSENSVNSDSNLSSFSSQLADDPVIVSIFKHKPNFNNSDGDLKLTESNNNVNSSNETCTNLYLDPEWLCILRSTNHLMSTSKVPCILPEKETSERCDFSATDDEIQALYDPFGGDFQVPDNFERTAAIYKPNETSHMNTSIPICLIQQANALSKEQQLFSNPQTELICAMLDLVNPNALFLGKQSCSLLELSAQLQSKNEEEDDDVDENVEGSVCAERMNNNENQLDISEYPSDTNASWFTSDLFIKESVTEYDPMNSAFVSNTNQSTPAPARNSNLHDSVFTDLNKLEHMYIPQLLPDS
ncbi:Lariat debranching enzyme [Schistosoma japonicum]|uniref:Lariat debranching enzyme n=1 Tax=Schistosoma japonicum TaxID=6182 RepID=A0A4Z2DWD5_SCHJA|nr:Lariat debranching enzyme [Schistosoma japonicum]